MRMSSLPVAVLAPAASFAYPGDGASNGAWSQLHYLKPEYLGAALIGAGLLLAWTTRTRGQPSEGAPDV
jgi:hypothetical protein